MNGQIIITVTENDEGTNVGVDMRMLGVSMIDKMMLLHSVARSFEMSLPDLEVFILAERIGVLDDADTTKINRGAIEEALGDRS